MIIGPKTLGYTPAMLKFAVDNVQRLSRGGFGRPSLSRAVSLSLVLVFLVAGTSVAGEQKSKKSKKAKPDDQIKFGVRMAQRGLWSEALFRFEQANRRAPDDAKILNNLAICYESLGLFEKALEHYREALKHDSTNKVLRRNYARFVEFYQAFNPPEEGVEGEAGDTSLGLEEKVSDPDAQLDSAKGDSSGRNGKGGARDRGQRR